MESTYVFARTHSRETQTEHYTHILTMDQAKRSTRLAVGALHAIDWKCANDVVLGGNIIAQVHALSSPSACVCTIKVYALHVPPDAFACAPSRPAGGVGVGGMAKGLCCA